MNKAILEYKAILDDEGKTVETIWKKKFKLSSKLFTKLKLNGKLTLNGAVCKSIDIISDGDILSADVTENESSENIVPTEMKLNILYEDAFILVVNKGRGMSVHPSIRNYDNTLANGVVFYWNQNNETHKFHAVNRIDKDTSGICVIAKNQFAHGVLSEQIKAKLFQRKYKALIHGRLTPLDGIINKPIKRENDSVIKRVVSATGKNAVTEYKTLKSNGTHSLVEVVLHTGRTHQIRVHFSHMGNPLVGDWLYGNGDNERNITKGHLLHAYYAKFSHPYSGKMMEFSLPLPEDMRNFV